MDGNPDNGTSSICVVSKHSEAAKTRLKQTDSEAQAVAVNALGSSFCHRRRKWPPAIRTQCCAMTATSISLGWLVY